MSARDALTLDFPATATVAARFPEETVRASTTSERVARAVSATLKAHDDERQAVADKMSDYLGERVTKSMLDQYASQAAGQHTIPAHRLIALAIVTGDARLINALLVDTGLVAVQAKYELLIEREMLKEEIENKQRRAEALDAQWRARR